MNRILTLVVCGATSIALGILVAGPAAGQEAGDAKKNQDVRVTNDLVYAEVDDQPLMLDLHLPSNAKNPPLVVWIHGGGWRAGSRQHPKVIDLTRHGYAVASISYRLTDRAIFPAQIHDCKAAVRWLRATAGKHGYDADWIAVAGSSAGGHLALLMGTSGGVKELEGNVGEHLDQSSTVQAVVDYFGPSDFVLRGKTQPGRAYTTQSGSFALLGGLGDPAAANASATESPGGERLPRLPVETERFASPANYVSADDPPLLVFHGKQDKTVLLDQSEQIVSLYSDAGLEAELVVLPKAAHGGKPFFVGNHFQTLVKFLNRHRPN